ncbi:M28 family peptidase [Bdellovibrio sp. HCB209]|uniref:M28 family peptidase n=1 Tax=Bdellovibrio sp. HCB209 TaxID=3394354 RepID=UPI0039B3F25E
MKKEKVLLKYLLPLTALAAMSSSCQSKETKTSAPESHGGTVGAVFVNSPNSLVSETRQMTFVGPKSGEGYFSPDGSHMIFQSEREPGNPFYQMYVMNLKSGETRRVSTGTGKTTCGWIHPSMKKVMFSSTHADPDSKKKMTEEIENRKKAVKAKYSWSFDENYDIWTSDLEGKNLKRLTKEKGYDAEGAYSPDGKHIVFASNRAAYTEKMSSEDQKYFDQDPSYMMDIYIMNADGSNVRRLTDAKGYDGGPFFSADGKKITWRRFNALGTMAEIYTMNIDGSEQKPVTKLKSMSWAPFFHPSGDYIVFGSSVLGFTNFELFIVDAAGKSDPVRVTFADDFDGLPVFTPDGKNLSWTHRNQKGDSQIVMAKWDDAQARRLLKLPTNDPAKASLSADINVTDLKTWVGYLTQNEFAGRSTGGTQEKVYSDKLAELFKAWGLKPAGTKGTYFQTFEFTSGVSLGDKNLLEVIGKGKSDLKVSQDYQPLSFSKNGPVSGAPIVFAGYGIKAPASDKEAAYDSYKGLDVKNKWVMVFTDLPENIPSARRQYLNLYSRMQHKVTVAKNEGAVGLIAVYGPSSQRSDAFGSVKFEGSLSESSIAVIRVSAKLADDLLKRAGKDLKSEQSVLDKGEVTPGIAIPSTYLKANIDLQYQKSKGINVIAELPVKGAKSSILIGAHGDHLGLGVAGSSLAKKDEQGLPHGGADDNASGVAGVMELAHYYANLQKTQPGKLKKSLMFAVWSGEELGNLGSTHFTKEMGTRKIEAYLNMDMVGRLRDRLFVQGLGSGDTWTAMAEQVEAKTLVPMVTQEDPYLPTDSLALYMAGVPTAHFFTGAHQEYHTPRDTMDLLNFEGLVKVLDVVKGFNDQIAMSSKTSVKYVKVASSQNNMEGRIFRVYVGTIPDYTQEGIKGVLLSGVSKDSPAEKAGLLEKDVMIEFDNTKIDNIYDYVYALQAVKPNKETTLKVLRSGKVIELKVTPKLKE